MPVFSTLTAGDPHHIHTHTQTHAHTHTCTHMHTYMHTHACTHTCPGQGSPSWSTKGWAGTSTESISAL